MKTTKNVLLLFFLVLLVPGCMRYLTQNRAEVLLDNVDIDQTLLVAQKTLDKGGWGSVLTVWAIRDQILSGEQAQTVAKLYFDHIDTVGSGFNEWHLTWAIANMYRFGNESVQSALQLAYNDAKTRAAQPGKHSNKFVNGDKMYLGDAHSGGRYYAHRHVVVPGNKRYLQSYQEFIDKQKQK